MKLDFTPLIIAGLSGFILILVRFWRTIYLLSIKKLVIKANFGWAFKFGRFRATTSPICDRIIEYFIAIIVAFFSFYSAYLLRVNKTLDDEKRAAIALLKQAEIRCSSLEPILKDYTIKSEDPIHPHILSDTEVVLNYCNNSMVQPFYYTDAVKPEKMLSYLSPRGFEVLSALEENQRVAHNNILDTTLSFLRRHLSFIAFMKFEFLRDSLFKSERLRLQDSITLNKLEYAQEHINNRDSIIYGAVNPFFPHQVLLDTTEDKLDNIAEVPEPDIESAALIDSLRYYSYLMIGSKSSGGYLSTNCFFLKQNTNLYLVNTYHAMTSWVVWDTSRAGLREPDYPDTFRLRLYTKKQHKCDYIPIDISKVKKYAKRISGYSDPDIYFYPISDTSLEAKYEINTINRFLSLDRGKYQKPTDVIVTGCFMPSSQNPLVVERTSPVTYFTHMLSLYELNVFYTALPNSDFVNYRITPSLDYTYWGSPIFFKELVPDIDNFKEVIIFGGIYTGPEQKESGMAVRPEQILMRWAHLK